MPAPTYTPFELIERLVAFDTVSAKSNLPLIDFIEAYLADHGIAARRTVGADGAKANLFATVGRQDQPGGLVLSGHTDVVPVTDQPWDSDPFQVVRKDGRLYGRGTADMKSFIAIVLALLPEMLARPLATPLHLAFSYDEEVGCLGVGNLIADLTANLPLPRMAIIGEPTELKLVNAHKGCHVFRTTVTGRAAHTSLPHLGANAIAAAARIVGFLESQAAHLERDERFHPPTSTIQVCMIDGGVATNVVPSRCSIAWDLRALPAEDVDGLLARLAAFCAAEVLPALRAVAPEADVATERVATIPPFAPEAESPAEALVRQLTGANRAETVSFGTEAGHFQAAGLSVVVCGPGSIDQAHQPNEFITLAQVEAGTAFVRRLIDWARNGA